MLTVFLVIFAISKCDSVYAQKESLVLVQDISRKQMYCVTNEIDRAVVWNTPLDVEYANATSVIFPNKSYVKLEWSRENSIKTFFGVVLDSRWESFPIVTSESPKFGNLKFTLLKKINEFDTFEIPVSTRVGREAHLYICETAKQPFENQCYWFILGGWNGSKSVLRKCKVNEIAPDSVSPKGDCANNIDEVNKNPLRRDKFVHFTIRFNSESKSISMIMHGEEKAFLSYVDRNYDENQIYESVWVNSRLSAVGFWRIHDYDFYIMRPFKVNKILTTPYLSNVCISMYAALCKDCSLTLTLNEKYPQKMVETKSYSYNKDLLWQKIFISHKGSAATYELEVSVSAPYSSTPYLAIDKVSVTDDCSDKEIKYSTLSANIEKVACAFLTGGGKIHPQPLTNITDLDLKCPLNTFGPNCISCSLLENKCSFSKICQYQNNDEVCYCSSGFMNDQCDTECSKGNFGLYCSQTCGYCYQSTCNVVDGYCPGKCDDNFQGSYCNETINPVLKEPPKLLGECYTTCRFSIDAGNCIGINPPVYYKIFYRLNNGRWLKIGEDINISEKEFSLINLRVSSLYTVKVALCTSAHQCYNNLIPMLNFTTSCKELQEDKVAINVSSYSAVFIISNKNIDFESCPLNKYLLIINEGSTVIYNSTLTNTNLVQTFQPYHNYQYIIINTNSNVSLAGKFTTDEAVPGEVTNIGFNSTSDELHIFWEAPTNMNGLFYGYYVQLVHTSYIACNSVTKDKQLNYQGNITDTFIQFNNLYPYSVYSVTIRAMNSKYIGNSYRLSADTQESDKFIPDAYKVSVASESTRVVIGLSSNCTSVYSPYVGSIELSCSEVYCPEPINKWINITAPIRVQALAPYTEYNLLTRIVTKFQNDNQLPAVTFRTKPDVPYAARNFELIAIADTSVYFRFSPPYPPTGVIETYWLKIVKYRQYKPDIIIFDAVISPYECEIWRWMLCVHISRLEHGAYYYYYLSVKNKDVSGYSPSADIQRYLLYGVPDPPINVNGTWDDFYNLTLSWQHPNKSNGILTSFNIYLNNQYNHKYRIQKINLTYSYTVENLPNMNDAETNIAISSENNNKNASIFVTYIIKNPPPRPEFKVYPMIKELSNQTVTVEIPPVMNQVEISYLYVIVTKDKESDDPAISTQQLNLIENWIDLPNDKSGWIAKEYKLNSRTESVTFIAGDGERMYFNRTNEGITNWELQADTSFKIYFVALNERANYERRSVYSISAKTIADDIIPSSESNMLIYISLIFIIIPIVLFVIYIRKKRIRFTSLSSRGSNSRRAEAANVQIPDTIPLTNTSDTSSQNIIEEPKLPSKFSKRVNLVDFEEYIKESIFDGELARQHALFPKGEQKPNDYGKLAANKSKNRYVNLVSYNHSRVKLKKLPGDECSDYINANYIKGLTSPKAYIATQGPKPNTVNDFWRMIWEENVANIVMLANVFENGKKKTEKYWPNYNEEVDFADINVRHISTETFADYEIRNFIIKYDDEERKVEQLHFTTWPDHGVPLYPQSLVPFLRRILTFPHGSKPIVIHCSAGVGRTGTIILIDLSLRMAAQMGYVDVLHHLYQLREQRTNMVDNIEQYILAHLVILECLFSPDTAIRCNEDFEESMKKVIDKELHNQMEYIEKSAWQEEAISMTGKINRKEYPEKDRFPGEPVENYGILYLPPYPPSDESSTYINACAVDGFRSRKRFIATQNPLPNTVGDFWRLALDNDVYIIVSLQEIDFDDPTCCHFLPSKKAKVLNATPIITVHHIKTEDMETHKIVSVSLHYKDEQRKIKIITLNDWKFGESCISNKNELLAAWQQMNQLSWNENRVLITCRDGFTACGLYLAMCFTLEKIKLEQICDVCHAVRVIRRSRRQFVKSEEQFIALYEIVDLYLRDFELYANFGTRQ